MPKQLAINYLINEYLKTKDSKVRDEIVFLWEIKLKTYIENNFSDYYDKESLYYYGLFEGIQVINNYNENMNKKLNILLRYVLLEKLTNYAKKRKQQSEIIIEEKYNSNRELEDYVVQKDYLEQGISLLDEKHKKVFLLHIAGYSHSEIAKMYGCSTSNISLIYLKAIHIVKYNKKNNLSNEKLVLKKLPAEENIKIKKAKSLNLKSEEKEVYDFFVKKVNESEILEKQSLLITLQLAKSDRVYNFLKRNFTYFEALLLWHIIFYDKEANMLFEILNLNSEDYKEILIKGLQILKDSEYKDLHSVTKTINCVLDNQNNIQDNNISKDNDIKINKSQKIYKRIKHSIYMEAVATSRIYHILKKYYSIPVAFVLSEIIWDKSEYQDLKKALKESDVKEAEESLKDALEILHKEKYKNIKTYKLSRKL